MNVLPPTATLTSVFSGAAVCADPGVETVAQAVTTIAANFLKNISNSLWRFCVAEFLCPRLTERSEDATPDHPIGTLERFAQRGPPSHLALLDELGGIFPIGRR